MASFTDIVPQFNPYVQQLPVEAMVQVGMEKQKRYDEGIQKIQGFIDNIAGLDILRGVDKQYLQSKLNELGNNVTALAGGDFSNYQLVNSVAGMASQIVKDPNIEAAVGSTAFYRKQLANIETAIKEGKSAQSNIYDFNSKANEYMESTDLGRKFSDRYSPYIDVRKKLLEAIKAAHPNASVKDIPFEIGPDGKITGIADAMVRLKVEGISENDIKQIAYATLTPDDLNQIAIDGRYELRGVGVQDLGNRVRSDYDRSFNQAVEAMDMLESMKATTKDPKKLLEIEQRLEYYNRQIGTSGEDGELYKAYENNIRRIENDPDSVKYSIYKDAFISEFANAFSWKNQERLYMTNPLKVQQNFIQSMKQRQIEFKTSTALRVRGLEISAANLQLQKQEFLYRQTRDAIKDVEENKKKLIEQYGVNLPAVPLAASTMDESNAVQVFTENMINPLENSMKASGERLARMGFKVPEIALMVNKYKSGNKKLMDEIPARARGLIQTLVQDNDRLDKVRKVYQDIEKQAKQEIAKERTPLWIKDDNAFTAWMKTTLVMSNELLGKSFKAAVLERTNKILADRYANAFVATLKNVGLKEDGTTTMAALNGLRLISEEKKASGGSGVSDAAFGDKAKDTKIYVRQNGYNYDIVVKNSEAAVDNVIEGVSADRIAQYFGVDAINNKQIETQFLKSSGNASTNLSGKPEDAMYQSIYGSFPNVRRYKITGDLLEDGEDPNLFVPKINVLGRDGNYIPFEFSGRDGNSRVGFDQGVSSFRNLTDDELTNMIMEQYGDEGVQLMGQFDDGTND